MIEMGLEYVNSLRLQNETGDERDMFENQKEMNLER